MRGEKFEIAVVEKQLVNALKSDVDLLCRRFAEGQSTQLEFFADIFKAKEFSTIFLGRLAISELVEFTESLLLHCARYMVAETTPQQQLLTFPYPNYVLPDFQGLNKGYEVTLLKLRANRTTKDRIFGIYMCYCLYFLQPAQYVMPIRVSTRQMDELYRFMHDVLLVEEHFEVMFCLFRMVDCGAFSITPFETEFNPLTLRRFDAYEEDEAHLELSELETCADFPLLTQLSEDVIFKQLSAIHDAYKRMKDECNLPSVSNTCVGATSDLAGFVQKLLVDTKAALKAEREADKNAVDGGGGAGESARSNRAKIRQNAYASSASRSHFESKRRHRISTSSTPHVPSSDLPQSRVDPSEFDGERPSTSKAAAAATAASLATANTSSPSPSTARKRVAKTSAAARATPSATKTTTTTSPATVSKMSSTKKRIKEEMLEKQVSVPTRASLRLKAKFKSLEHNKSDVGEESKFTVLRSEVTEE